MNSPDLHCACAAARLTARVLTQFYDDRLRDAGLEAPQFALLMTIEQAGPCSQVDLGTWHAMDKTTISRNLKLLENKGLVERKVGSDKRKLCLSLTPDGRERLGSAKPRWKNAQQQLRSTMTPAQWDAVFLAFQTVTKAVRSLAAVLLLVIAGGLGIKAQEPNRVKLIPKDLEMRLAVNALPKELRDGATVLVLESSGYKEVHHGTNPFTCIVSRRGGNFYPVCFDEEGTRTILPAFAEDAVLRLKGLNDEEVEHQLATGFQQGKYRPPARPGVAICFRQLLT